jgi:uncharacterized membrane protein YfcA
MRFVTDELLQPIIGIIVLLMLAVHYWHARVSGEDAPVPSQWWFAATLGFVAGVTTMMANAAGPVMVIYLLAMRLPKLAFVGTSAWFFFAVNWLKVPSARDLNLITLESIKLDLLMLPLIAAGRRRILFLKHIEGFSTASSRSSPPPPPSSCCSDSRSRRKHLKGRA